MIKVPMSLCFADIESPPFPLPRLLLGSFLSPIFFFAHADFFSFSPQWGAWSQASQNTDLPSPIAQHVYYNVLSVFHSVFQREATGSHHFLQKSPFTVMFIHCHRTKILAQILPSIKREKNTEVKREKTKLKSNDMRSWYLWIVPIDMENRTPNHFTNIAGIQRRPKG